MLQKLLENGIKKVLPIRRYVFKKIKEGTGLKLDYKINRGAGNILETIFIHREYADYFPAGEAVTIVDVGAHYGYFSLFAALNSSVDSRILAVEPSPDNLVVLQKNLSQNDFHNIQAVNIALDAESGKRDFYGGIPHNHSFFKTSQDRLSSANTLSLKDFIEQHKIEQLDFLKLDCEGAEFPILLNADQKVFDKITTISMEFHDLPDHGYSSLQLIRHLNKHGFEIVKYTHAPDYSATNLNFGKIIATKYH